MRKKLLGGIFLLVLSLCACGRTITSTEQEGKEYYQPGYGYKSWEYPILEAKHGDDYVIEWEDKGMEAHVRLYLRKPEGNIYHSDVWNIRVVYIGDSGGYDAFIERPKEDRDYFVLLDDVLDNQTLHQGDLPDILSLQDLRHFDSLQIINVDLYWQEEPLADISGAEECPNLQVFRVFGGSPESLECISKMENLERLSVCDCTNEEKLDLTPLEGLENLFWLQLGGTKIESLEPISKLDLLFLDLGCYLYNQKAHEDLDHSPIAKMDSLLYLDLGNNIDLEKEELETILQKIDGIETVDVTNIFSRKERAELRQKFPDVRIREAGE